MKRLIVREGRGLTHPFVVSCPNTSYQIAFSRDEAIELRDELTEALAGKPAPAAATPHLPTTGETPDRSL